MEEIVRLAFSLIDPLLFPPPSWLLTVGELDLKDADHARMLADQHREPGNALDGAELKIAYLGGVLDALVMMAGLPPTRRGMSGKGATPGCPRIEGCAGVDAPRWDGRDRIDFPREDSVHTSRFELVSFILRFPDRDPVIRFCIETRDGIPGLKRDVVQALCRCIEESRLHAVGLLKWAEVDPFAKAPENDSWEDPQEEWDGFSALRLCQAKKAGELLNLLKLKPGEGERFDLLECMAAARPGGGIGEVAEGVQHVHDSWAFNILVAGFSRSCYRVSCDISSQK